MTLTRILLAAPRSLWSHPPARGLAAVHLPRIQEIKHTELIRQGLCQPLRVIHNVVVQVPAVGVEHLVLFVCSLDHERVAVPHCKRATSITWPTLLSPSQGPPLTPTEPSQTHPVTEEEAEMGEERCQFWDP